MTDSSYTTAIKLALAFKRIHGIGRVKLRKILLQLSQCSDINVPFQEIAREYLIDEPRISSSEIDDAWSAAQRIFDDTQDLYLRVFLYGWPSYPLLLQRLKDAPALLFVRGDIDWNMPAVAVIGTRHNSPWGETTAKLCARTLAELKSVVVSGLALGIDSIAQKTVVDRGGVTWAVLAHGLHTVSPSSNRDLAKRIIESGGALVSEYLPGEHAQRSYFVERDRIQAGLSRAILVIETGIHGGSMHTVSFGRDASIPIWVTFPEHQLSNSISISALPETQQGTWTLMKEGASRIVAPSDLSNLWQAILEKQNSDANSTIGKRLF
jgi:DNA processing protein